MRGNRGFQFPPRRLDQIPSHTNSPIPENPTLSTSKLLILSFVSFSMATFHFHHLPNPTSPSTFPLLLLNPRVSRVTVSRPTRTPMGDLLSKFVTTSPNKPRVRVPPSRASGGKREAVVGDGKLLVASGVTVALAVANRVLYKLALVPMKEYPFFMAQLTTFGYVVIYFTILYGRYHLGIVTKDMLNLPKSRFMAIGLLEALGVASGMAAAAMLPGPAIPILSQVFLVWQLMFSFFFLGRRYSYNQVLGCFLVAAGVVTAVASGASGGQPLSKVGAVWPALLIASSGFQAGASILKEFIFIDATKRLKGKVLDIFVVNSFGSGFQALFVFLLLPFLSVLKGIPFPELPSYLKSGAGCFMNTGVNTTGCEGAPWLPLLYMIVNMSFNISALNLVKLSSALVTSLSLTLAVPISILVLTFPLPYTPQPASLDAFFVVGTVILMLGLMLYNLPRLVSQKPKSN